MFDGRGLFSLQVRTTQLRVTAKLVGSVARRSALSAKGSGRADLRLNPGRRIGDGVRDANGVLAKTRQRRQVTKNLVRIGH